MRNALSLVLAVAAGLVIAWFDARASEVQGAVLLLLACGAALGALAPRVAPVAGLLLGAGVPVMYLWMQWRALPTQANGFVGTLLALIPALLGTFAGAMLGRALTPGQAGGTRA